MNARLYGRTIFVLIFGIIGAIALGDASEGILGGIYRLVMRGDVSQFKYYAWEYVPMAILGALSGGYIGSLALLGMERLVEKWDRMHVGDKVTLFLGVFAGIVASVPVLLIFQNIPNFDPFWKFLGICAVTVGFMVMTIDTLMSMSEYLPWNRGRPSGRRSRSP